MKHIIVILMAVAVCGTNALTFDESNRITNGNLATDFQFPYMVSLQQTSQIASATRGHRCGGVLITFQHVLTAASCLINTVDTTPVQITLSEYRVFAGSAILTNDFVQDRVRFIANATIHPEYIGPPAHINDIAIITLSAPFLNSTVTPIALPAANFIPADFTLCTVAGWGSPDGTVNVSTQLRYTTKYVYGQNLCTNIYAGLPYISNVFPSMICAASYDIISSGCFGDEGSALVCNSGLTGILFLTNQCAPSSYPELYTRVSNYTTWIRSVTGGASTFRADIAMWTIFALVQIISIKVITKD